MIALDIHVFPAPRSPFNMTTSPIMRMIIIMIMMMVMIKMMMTIPSAISSPPLLTLPTTINDLPSAYTCWPDLTVP